MRRVCVNMNGHKFAYQCGDFLSIDHVAEWQRLGATAFAEECFDWQFLFDIMGTPVIIGFFVWVIFSLSN